MNYLSHYVYNHEICGLPCEPYFVMGVALPDLWLRYSRSRRIRWRALESAVVTDSMEVTMVFDDETESILPRFRESAYTKIKQEIGEEIPEKINDMERKIEKAASDSIQKRKTFIEYIRNL